jgi:hypothetical protein
MGLAHSTTYLLPNHNQQGFGLPNESAVYLFYVMSYSWKKKKKKNKPNKSKRRKQTKDSPNKKTLSIWPLERTMEDHTSPPRTSPS